MVPVAVDNIAVPAAVGNIVALEAAAVAVLEAGPGWQLVAGLGHRLRCDVLERLCPARMGDESEHESVSDESGGCEKETCGE